MQFLLPLRKLSLSLISLLLAVSPALLPIRAAAQQRTVATADIPFDFVAGTGHLPAGRYHIVRVYENLYAIRSTDCAHVQMVGVNHAISAALPDSGKLVFRRYGDRYFLANLWIAGDRTGLQMVRSQAEKEMLNASAAPPAAEPATEVALNRGASH